MGPQTASPQRPPRPAQASSRPQPARPARTAPKSGRFLWIALGLGLIAIGLVLSLGRPGKDAARRAPSIPVTRNIVSGSVQVKPRGGVQYRFEVTPDMRDAQLVGNFTAYGGSTNGVSAVIMEASEYDNWISGHRANAYYSTEGQKSTDRFAVRLSPGIYFFGISNRLSKTASKLIYVDIDLIYYRSETDRNPTQ